MIKLPAKISQSDLVLDFFEPTNEDISAMEPETEQYVRNIFEPACSFISFNCSLLSFVDRNDRKKPKEEMGNESLFEVKRLKVYI